MPPNTWVTCPRPNPQARLRLFCFPYAGGAASVFYPWPAALPAAVEVCPIQLPGRQARMAEPACTRWEPLLDALSLALRPFLDRPFAFFGHSLGTKIGFELARRLRAEGAGEPACLFFSGSRAPQVALQGETFHRLADDEFVATLARFNGIPAGVLQNPELLQLFLPILRADVTLYENYRYVPGEPFDCPVSVFGGLDDREVSRADLEAWRLQTRGPFVLRLLPGDHFFLNSGRALLLQALVQDLQPILA